METTVMNVAVSQGIWAVLAVFLLIYIVKSNEQRDTKQEYIFPAERASVILGKKIG